jgi:hypothetical protein
MTGEGERMPLEMNAVNKTQLQRRGALVGSYLALCVMISIGTAMALHDRGGASRWFFGPLLLMLAIGVLLLAWKDRLGPKTFLGAAALLAASVVSFALGWAGLDMLLFVTTVLITIGPLWRRRGKRPN